MSKRNEWVFEMTAENLAEGVRQKIAHHQDRLSFWQKGRDETIAKVKESGLTIDESLAGSNYTKSGYGPEMVVDATLQRKLQEAHKKIGEHAGKVSEYDGWLQTLVANSGRTYPLHADDYLYFFGK